MAADGAIVLFDEEVRLLLRAAVLPAERALPAFREWRARCDLDAMRAGPQRLLPLVHANIALTPADDIVIARIKGIRKYCWIRNLMLAGGGAAAVRALAAEQIPTILLKGAAMVAEWYRNPTLRPMGDVDLLVPTDQAIPAIRCLGASGWTPRGSSVQALCEVHVHRLHAWNFMTPSGHSLDLHWHALHQAQQDGADCALWSRTRPTAIASGRTAVLAPEEQLFQILVHGLQAIADDAYLWPADAAWILRRDGAALDWGRVVALAARARLTLQVGAGLRFLRETLEVAVPDAAFAGLVRTRATWSERREFALRRVAPSRLGRMAIAFLNFQDFRRRSGDLIVRAAREAAIPFLQNHWRIDRPGATLAYAAAAALGRPAALKRLWLVRPRKRLLRALQPHIFKLGVLSFTQPLGDTLVYGWSEPEPNGRWNEGPEAVSVLDLQEPPAYDLLFEADADPLLAEGHVSMTIDVWVNEYFAARWRARHNTGWLDERRCTIPAHWLAGARQLAITFVIRRPRRPADISESSDRRTLGLFVRSLRFTADAAAKPSRRAG
jgi:hypothetical protein